MSAAPRRGRLARYGASALVVAGLCGLAFAAGAHGGLGRAPMDVASTNPAPALDTRAQTDELTNTIRQMAEDLRALKARVDQQAATPVTAPDTAAAAAGVAQLASRIDSLDSRVTAKLSQLGEQVAGLQQPAAASHPAPIARTPVARARPEKHAKHVHDAFDPTLDPYAPGAPRPLGSR